jgi:hypothetical protein
MQDRMIQGGSQPFDIVSPGRNACQGTASSGRPMNDVQCPQCGFGFELSTLVRDHLEAEVRARLQSEVERKVSAAATAADERVRAKEEDLATTRTKLADAAAREAELLRQQRESAEREQGLGLEFERRLDDETRRIRKHEACVAQERFARDAEERVRPIVEELETARTKLAAATAKEAETMRKEREVAEREVQLGVELERRLADETKCIREQETRTAQERCAREANELVRVRDEELASAHMKLADAAAKEADLLRRQREADERERRLAVEVECRIADETKRVREQEAQNAAQRAELEREKQRLRDEDHRQTIEGLRKHIEELQRKVHQGSEQLQGETQEVVLRSLLAEVCVEDGIEDVPIGALGGDVLQRVRAADRRDCGTIIWESKRTKAWSDDWLPKLRDDQRAAGASMAVIVSQALPAGVRHFTEIDRVWVCGWPYAAALATVLRTGLIDVATAKRVAEGRGSKIQMMFDYLTGPEFRNRVAGVMEAFAEMQAELEREKRATLTAWKRREKQMVRARDNLTAFYGDLQGIAGQQLKDLPLLSLDVVGALPSRELTEAEPDDDAHGEETGASRPDEAALATLLFSLLPEDGSAVGNGSLSERFIDTAFVDRGLMISNVDYERCRARLLAQGTIRKGKGKGGSVARTLTARVSSEDAA